tara:strand:- start:2654 stop:3367 length:714 start_codon:yes stop_codon:yes gene_type:complete
MKKLGINIDHVATLRNARGEDHPNILSIAKSVVKSGASSITVHLREDRRHINDNDLKNLCKKKFKINLEMAANNKMFKIALKNNPNYVCIVPEKRNEITTEGGLNLNKNFHILKKIIFLLNKKKIRTSLFIDPNLKNIHLSKKIGSKCVELHTGKFSRLVKSKKKYKIEYKKLKKCASEGNRLGLKIHAGHGLDYKCVKILKHVKEIEEYNIGHFIIGESLKDGIVKVIKTFKKILC